MSKFMYRLSLVGSVFLWAFSCQSNQTSPALGTQSWSLTGQAQTNDVGLCDMTWLSDPSGRFLVTPRWSPAGDRLLFSGKNGVGLFALDPQTKGTFQIDPQAQGRVYWSQNGSRVAYRTIGSNRVLSEFSFVDKNVPPLAPVGLGPRFVDLKDATASSEILFESKDGQVVFEEYRGRIALLNGSNEKMLVEDHAWGVSVAPNGRTIAYCTGHLAQPQLHLVNWAGEVRDIGAGAHPAWFPDSHHLVYSAPQSTPAADGSSPITSAELFLLDVDTGIQTALTASPQVIEMEPTVSKLGQIAASDWQSGRLMLARICSAENHL